jgi:hypothetical protein
MTRTSPRSEEVVDRPEALTPAWLTEVLRGAGHDVAVSSVRCEPVGTGQMGRSVRMHLEGSLGDLPRTLVAKLPAEDESRRAMVAGIYRTEVEFYRSLAPTLAVRTPVLHHSELGEDHTRFVLVLEDLAPRVQGDQLAGCTLEMAEVAVENLAGLHGPRWCDPTLEELDWLSAIDADGAAMVGAVTADATERFLDRYRDRLLDEDVQLLRSLPEVLPGWVLARSERFAPLHGDYRLDNLLFGQGPDPVAAVDWQTVTLGLPARDLAYFAGTGLTTDLRRRHEAQLVERYHRALTGHGVQDHPLEQCWDDYRFGMLQGPLITIVGAAYGEVTERGDEMFLAMASRSCAAIRDLRTLDLL